MPMNPEQQQLLRSLRDRIEMLKSLYLSQKETTETLTRQNETLGQQLEEYKRKISILEKQYESVRLAQSVASPAGNADEAKLQIMRIVREIDDCIALLNK